MFALCKVSVNRVPGFPLQNKSSPFEQGWKVIDVTKGKRAHLSEFLNEIPEKTYSKIDEVIKELRAIF